jgi:hypothetical protein
MVGCSYHVMSFCVCPEIYIAVFGGVYIMYLYEIEYTRLFRRVHDDGLF